jgi:hypothetical protein
VTASKIRAGMTPELIYRGKRNRIKNASEKFPHGAHSHRRARGFDFTQQRRGTVAISRRPASGAARLGKPTSNLRGFHL